MAQKGALNKAYSSYNDQEYAKVLQFTSQAESHRTPTPELQAEILFLKALALERMERPYEVRGLLQHLAKNYPDTPYGSMAKVKLSGSDFAHNPDSGANKRPEERPNNAQETEKRLNNDTNMSECQLAGNFRPNADLTCIPIGEATNRFNPPTLLYAAKKCIRKNEYSKAWALISTGIHFASYDITRLADRSTPGVWKVLSLNVFADLSKAEKETFQQISREIQSDPEQVKAYCAELTRIGQPAYKPHWAVLHCTDASRESTGEENPTNAHTKALWEKVVKTQCTSAIEPK